jgi:hypothetical protein
MLPTSILASLQRILQKILTRLGAWNIVRLFSLPLFNLGVLHSTRLATLFHLPDKEGRYLNHSA